MFRRCIFRFFDSKGRSSQEFTFGRRLQDINVLTGKPKPTTHEGEWKCEYALHEPLENVLRIELKKRGWSQIEIDREVIEMFAIRKTENPKAAAGTCETMWNTVEEFQRTPWFKRYRPNDNGQTHYVSYETFKVLEEAVIPPTMRKDPYFKMRKRHYEDLYMNERYHEDQARYITREKLAKQTKGMAAYGSVSRKGFLEFEKEWKAKHPGVFTQKYEIYQQWLKHQDSNNKDKTQ
eukprot:PhF_6_TR28886/c0_g1_i1/m.42218